MKAVTCDTAAALCVRMYARVRLLLIKAVTKREEGITSQIPALFLFCIHFFISHWLEENTDTK